MRPNGTKISREFSKNTEIVEFLKIETFQPKIPLILEKNQIEQNSQ